jgi:hypothetical protein
LAWSTKSTSAAQIKTFTARHREAQPAGNVRDGFMSVCAVDIGPGAVYAPQVGNTSDRRMVCQLTRGTAASAR